VHPAAHLDVPTIDVTDRPLSAAPAAPGPRRGDRAELRMGGELVGFSLRMWSRRVVEMALAAGRAGTQLILISQSVVEMLALP